MQVLERLLLDPSWVKDILGAVLFAGGIAAALYLQIGIWQEDAARLNQPTPTTLAR